MILTELINYEEIDHLAPSDDPFVYETQPAVTNPPDWWTDTFGVEEPAITERIYIRSLLVAFQNRYARHTSYDDCQNQESSFYWDDDNQILYIHVDHDESWYTTEYSYGRVRGYSDDDVVYVDDVLYEPLISSVPSISQQEDLQNYEKLAFMNGSIVMNSTEQKLDWIIDANLYGNEVFLYHIADTLDFRDVSRDDLTELAAFYIENYDPGLRETVLHLQDIRKAQNVSIPVTRFNTTDYADLDEKYEDKPIPLQYGAVAEAEAIPVDSESTGNVTFRLAKTLTVLGQVQIFSDDVWTDVTPSSTSLSTGSFVLAYADCRKDGATDGDVLRCRVVSSTGEAVTYASDIIKALNLEALGIVYNESNYDTDEWESEETDISAIGVRFEDDVELFESIRQVQSGADVGFRYEIKPDGRRTIRVDDRDRDTVGHVANLDLANRDTLQPKSRSELLAAIVTVDYKRNYEADEYRTYQDTSSRDTVLETYRQKPTLPITTLLQTSALAADRATFALSRFATVPLILPLDIMGAGWYTLRIYDMLTVEITPAFVDRDSETITGREFFGVWLAQIISIAPNFARQMNRVQAVLVSKEF